MIVPVPFDVVSLHAFQNFFSFLVNVVLYPAFPRSAVDYRDVYSVDIGIVVPAPPAGTYTWHESFSPKPCFSRLMQSLLCLAGSRLLSFLVAIYTFCIARMHYRASWPWTGSGNRCSTSWRSCRCALSPRCPSSRFRLSQSTPSTIVYFQEVVAQSKTA